MLFNSFEFALFFGVCFGLYLVLPHRGQNRMLLLASYVFYAAWNWKFLSLIILSTLVDYTVGLRMGGETDPARRRRLVTISLAVNLGVLGFFKYANFFAESFSDLSQALGLPASSFVLDVVLPVGISFYTFQTLSYTIDIYRGRLEPTRDLPDFALFVAFFPQLVAGPIERASSLLPQIFGKRKLTWERVGSGSWLVLGGLFKKVVIADNLAPLVDMVYGAEANPTAPELIFATYAFAFQIYCDFSGYTDIARGIARMLGFDLMLNFRLPYAATGPSDFWRRWHISLSSWLRDYLYISLGGNRDGTSRTYRNLMLTMLLGGLWHGAAWPFVLWGAFHGGWLIVHRLLQPLLTSIDPQSASARTAWYVIRVLVTFHLVCLGWMMFRAASLAHVGSLLVVLGGSWDPGLVSQWMLPFACLTAPLIVMQVIQARTRELEVVRSWPTFARTGVYASAMIGIILFGETLGAPFVYFQF
jgi:alginate O-acetyltransferase complex protein AlgI